MRYLRYTAIKAREYHKALHSLDFIACLTRREFKRMYYNGSTALRGVRMPHIPTLLESHKAGLTPTLVAIQTRNLIRTMDNDIRRSREMRGACVDCGGKHSGSSFACVSKG